MANPTPHQRRILVIDDEPSVTLLSRRVLEQSGEFLVKEENDALRALETVRTFRPHLIFLDRHLPGRSGSEIAAEIDMDPVLKGTPIVFLTGDVDSAAVRHGHPVLLKPVRAADLRDTCQAWALAADEEFGSETNGSTP